MTRYTVVWHRRAQDLLTDIWIQPNDREDVSAASDRIDRELATDAGEKGVATKGRIRKLVIPPLNCLFHVVEADRTVHVVLVRRTVIDRAAGATRQDNGNGNTD